MTWKNMIQHYTNGQKYMATTILYGWILGDINVNLGKIQQYVREIGWGKTQGNMGVNECTEEKFQYVESAAILVCEHPPAIVSCHSQMNAGGRIGRGGGRGAFCCCGCCFPVPFAKCCSRNSRCIRSAHSWRICAISRSSRFFGSSNSRHFLLQSWHFQSGLLQKKRFKICSNFFWRNSLRVPDMLAEVCVVDPCGAANVTAGHSWKSEN